MTAAGAAGGLGAGFCGVKPAAADAMKGDLAAFRVVERVITTVVIEPDPTEKAEGEQTVDDGTEGEIHKSRVTAEREGTRKHSRAKAWRRQGRK